MSAVPEGIKSADVIVWGEGSTFTQQIAAGRHRLNSDEPESVGGTDTGPSPYELLLAALGSCTSMTVGMYARKKNWPLKRITVWLRHSRIYAADCSECETKEGMLVRIERDVRFEGPLSAEQQSRLLEIATSVRYIARSLRKSTSAPESCDYRARSPHRFFSRGGCIVRALLTSTEPKPKKACDGRVRSSDFRVANAIPSLNLD